MKVDIYQFYIVLSEYTLTFSNHFFKIIELASSSSYKANQKKYDKCYKKKSWNEAKEDPALHQDMMYQQRLKRQKSRLKGI